MSALTERRAVATERSPAIVMLAELRNFTRMSEMLEPQKVLDLASSFFTLAADAVEINGGEVFGVSNDTLTAAFRGGTQPEHARRAVIAAQQIRHRPDKTHFPAEIVHIRPCLTPVNSME